MARRMVRFDLELDDGFADQGLRDLQKVLQTLANYQLKEGIFTELSDGELDLQLHLLPRPQPKPMGFQYQHEGKHDFSSFHDNDWQNPDAADMPIEEVRRLKKAYALGMDFGQGRDQMVRLLHKSSAVGKTTDQAARFAQALLASSAPPFLCPNCGRAKDQGAYCLHCTTPEMLEEMRKCSCPPNVPRDANGICGNYATPQEATEWLRGRSKFPVEVSFDKKLPAREDACAECYGTGFVKGFGGPCTKGCKDVSR